MIQALRSRWPEYLMEGALLGLFMLSACLFTALLEHPSSPVRQAVPNGTARRGMMGLAMGATALGLIYSPWGRRSGAHLNPSVTLTFFRMGKVKAVDALFYGLFQAIGGIVGVWAAKLALQEVAASPAVRYAATLPGPRGHGAAFLAEVFISFLLMATVLVVSNHPRWAMKTGLFAGALVALYITFEAPLSGMSMNPARTLASTVFAGTWPPLWIYFIAPPLGMLAAAEVYRRVGRRATCAKLVHDNRYRCVFCGSGAQK